MQVNKPDRGIFKGMGTLETNMNVNKKNFPLIRNKNQFQFTHDHGNFYQSNFNYFYKSKFLAHSATNRFTVQKVTPKSNASQILLGTDRADFKSLNQTSYKNYPLSQPPKPIIQKQQGIGLSSNSSSFSKTTNQQFSQKKQSNKQNVIYKNWRGNQKYNPITGEGRNINNTFGYEDFKYHGDKERKYKANNFTKIPTRERFDIISGRKLPQFIN